LLRLQVFRTLVIAKEVLGQGTKTNE